MKLIYTLLFSILFVHVLSGQSLQATEKAALLRVEVVDFSGNPIENQVVVFRAEKTKKKVKRKTNAAGKFSILLPKGETYAVMYTVFLEDEDYSTIEIEDGPGMMEGTLEIELETKKNQVFELDVHYATNRAEINVNSYKLLDELVYLMKSNPEMVIEVAGHTDEDGSAAHNLGLSQDRSHAVKAYLVKKGIAANRVKSVGYGESRPVASNNSAEGKAQNRRTEVRILK